MKASSFFTASSFVLTGWKTTSVSGAVSKHIRSNGGPALALQASHQRGLETTDNGVCEGRAGLSATFPIGRSGGAYECLGDSWDCGVGNLSYRNCSAAPVAGASGYDHQCPGCVCGEYVPVKIQCHVNSAGSGRSRAFVIARIQFDKSSCGVPDTDCTVALCRDDGNGPDFPQGEYFLVEFPQEILWPCGSSIAFVGDASTPIILGGGTKSDSCRVGNCGRLQGECELVQETLPITSPLSVHITSQSDNVAVSYSIQGGLPPYSIELFCVTGAIEDLRSTQTVLDDMLPPLELSIQSDTDCLGPDSFFRLRVNGTTAGQSDETCTVIVDAPPDDNVCISSVTCNYFSPVYLEGCSKNTPYTNIEGLFNTTGQCAGTIVDFEQTGNEILWGSICDGLVLNRTWSASINGNAIQSCSFTMTVIDSVAPELLNCSDVTNVELSECDGSDFPPMFSCAALDNCDGIITVDPCCKFGGSLVRTWTIKDTCGNKASPFPIEQVITFSATTQDEEAICFD